MRQNELLQIVPWLRGVIASRAGKNINASRLELVQASKQLRRRKGTTSSKRFRFGEQHHYGKRKAFWIFVLARECFFVYCQKRLELA